MRRTRLQDLLDGLRRAAADDRVRVLVVKVGGSRIGLAKIQELRAAIGDFRRSGKLAVAWAESFGDFVRGNLPYYLATGFDRIYLQPSGTLGLTGVAVEQVFLHGALEKLGIDFESAKRHEYKSAPDQLTESGFTGPGPRGGRAARRVGDRAARRGDRRGPRAVGRAGHGAARPRAVPRAAGARRGPGRRADVPGRGVRPGPQGGRPGRDAALPAALPAHAVAGRPAAPAGQQRPGHGARDSTSGSSRRSTRTARSGTGAAAAAGPAAAGWARTRWRRRCARRRPTRGRAPSCCGSTARAAPTRRPT